MSERNYDDGTRFVECWACQGEGRELRGLLDIDTGECRACEGKGVVEETHIIHGDPRCPHWKADGSCCDFACGN